MLEGLRELGDGLEARSGLLAHRDGLGDRGRARDNRLGGLDVGGPSAPAVDERGLACVRKRHELGGHLAADLPRVGDHGPVLQVEALADASVGVRLVVVVLLERGLVDMEGVGVLHDELAPAQEPEAWTDLVAELHVDLVERDRQVAVAA